MKVMYCWRCGKEVPMLDEEEYAVISELSSLSTRKFKDRVRKAFLSESCLENHEQWLEEFGGGEDSCQLEREAYQRFTGTDEMIDWENHRISLYGPPCHSCGKPLRTSRASFCAACGEKRERAIEDLEGS